MYSKSGEVLVLLILATVAANVSFGQAPQPAIHCSPESPLLDDVLHIRLSGLPAKKIVTLRVQTEQWGRGWQGHASYMTDERGTVDVREHAALAGTYTGVDPMGLFWSMEPAKTSAAEKPPLPLKITDARLTRFELILDGKTVASKELKRWLARPGLRTSDVHEDGLVGKLFEPDGKGRHPAMLVLSGSEGGINETEAALLASRGYTTFALAYFGAKGLPKELVKIPLDYLKKGIDWLKKHPSVNGSRLGVIGGSKGGELALLLGATFPDIKVVIAYVPSHVAWSGIGGNFQEPAWTYQGKTLPYVLTRPGPLFFLQMAGKKPIALLDLYRSGLEDQAKVRKATIPVEKINGAVLLISGKNDQMWPSALMADKVMERLKEHKHPHPYQHLCYEAAGHAIVNAYVPLQPTIAAGRFALGGTPQANARALADSRPKVLGFLRDNLGQPYRKSGCGITCEGH